MKRFFFILTVLTLWALPLNALTMEEAVKIALENNHRIKDFKYKSEAQRKRIDSEKAPFWPDVDVSYAYERQESVFFFQTEDASTFTVEINYNLFNGFTDMNQLESAKFLLDASLYQQKATEADVALEAQKSYIELLRARQNQEVAEEAVSLLERQRREAELFYREGLTAKNELLKVEVELASTRQRLLQAESVLRVAKKKLERVLGVKIGEHEVIEDMGVIKPEEFSQEILTEEMLRRRSELRFLKAQHAAREFTRDSIKGGFLPSIDLSLTHSRFGETFAFEGRNDPLFDDDTRAMVVASWNIFDGFKKISDVRTEELEIRSIEERIKDTEEEVNLQLKIALEKYSVAMGRLEVANKAIEQAEENYRITDNQFRERIATATDLLDARIFLTRAHNEYTNALYDMYQFKAEIERVVEKKI